MFGHLGDGVGGSGLSRARPSDDYAARESYVTLLQRWQHNIQQLIGAVPQVAVGVPHILGPDAAGGK